MSTPYQDALRQFSDFITKVGGPLLLLGDTLKEAAGAERIIAERDQQLAALDQRITDARTQLSTLDDAIAVKRAEVRATFDDLAARVEARRQECLGQIAQAETDRTARIAALQSDLDAKLDATHTRLVALTAQVADRQKDLVAVNGQLSELTTHLTDLKQRVEGL